MKFNLCYCVHVCVSNESFLEVRCFHEPASNHSSRVVGQEIKSVITGKNIKKCKEHDDVKFLLDIQKLAA